MTAMRAHPPAASSWNLFEVAGRRVLSTVTALGGVVLAASGAPAASAAGPAWRAKVDPWVLDTVQAGGKGEFLVVLAEQANLSGAERRAAKVEKGRFVVERLREVAARTQPPVLADLAAHGAFAQPYWVVNVIWARGDLKTVQAIAGRTDVARIDANPWVAAHLPVPGAISDRSSALAAGIEPNVAHVGAPGFWAAGFTGQGAVVAGADTGVEWDHAALKAHYRGWNGSRRQPRPQLARRGPRRRQLLRRRLSLPLRRPRPWHPHHGDDGRRRRRRQPDRPGAGGQVDRLPQHEPGQRHAGDLHRVLPVLPGPHRPRRRQPRSGRWRPT